MDINIAKAVIVFTKIELLERNCHLDPDGITIFRDALKNGSSVEITLPCKAGPCTVQEIPRLEEGPVIFMLAAPEDDVAQGPHEDIMLRRQVEVSMKGWKERHPNLC